VFGFHIIQFLLFVARYIPSFTPVVGRLAWKHVNGRKGRHIDDSYKVFNFDCLVRLLPLPPLPFCELSLAEPFHPSSVCMCSLPVRPIYHRMGYPRRPGTCMPARDEGLAGR
jgi:hypothetical protein